MSSFKPNIQDRSNVLAVILGLVFIISVILALGSAMYEVLNMPVVYKNSVTGECVAVMTPDGFWDCTQRPEKYEYVYVDPSVTYTMLAKHYQ